MKKTEPTFFRNSRIPFAIFDPEKNVVIPGTKSFSYLTFFKGEKISGKKYVLCHNELDFLRLINGWNVSGNWKYVGDTW